jgi:hypothetical protein
VKRVEASLKVSGNLASAMTAGISDRLWRWRNRWKKCQSEVITMTDVGKWRAKFTILQVGAGACLIFVSAFLSAKPQLFAWGFVVGLDLTLAMLWAKWLRGDAPANPEEVRRKISKQRKWRKWQAIAPALGGFFLYLLLRYLMPSEIQLFGGGMVAGILAVFGALIIPALLPSVKP